MKIKEIIEILEGEEILSKDDEIDVKMGCGCDLMSDVLTFIKPSNITPYRSSDYSSGLHCRDGGYKFRIYSLSKVSEFCERSRFW